MELLFAHTYLLLFGKLAVGGLLALAVPPFPRMERGFYKSTAAVYVLAAYAMTLGDAYLLIKHGTRAPVSVTALTLWTTFCVLFTAYFVTLFVELPFLRARLYPAAVFSGLAALAATALAYVPHGVGVFAGVAFVVPVVAGAAVVGAGLTGMLLGHWYLIDTGLDLAPLRSMLAYCRVCLAGEIGAVAVAATLLWIWPASPWRQDFVAAYTQFPLLLVARGCAWALAIVLLALIRRTLEIPQTMAATGLFYIEALVIAVGQIVAHWLLFRTGLPL